MLLYEDIKRLNQAFTSFICSHIRRAGNTLAHLIARYDTSESMFVWFDNFSQNFFTLAELDLA